MRKKTKAFVVEDKQSNVVEMEPAKQSAKVTIGKLGTGVGITMSVPKDEQEQ